MQRRSCFFLFSFEEGKEEGKELCLRPETAPLKISSGQKKEEKRAKLSFLSFFLSSKKRILTLTTTVKPPELRHR